MAFAALIYIIELLNRCLWTFCAGTEFYLSVGQMYKIQLKFCLACVTIIVPVFMELTIEICTGLDKNRGRNMDGTC